ncbi:hypothetical protein L7F22_057118 [Adiantum nelumboides]|nr:hypothetical protein [Adiantum nelumboides]
MMSLIQEEEAETNSKHPKQMETIEDSKKYYDSPVRFDRMDDANNECSDNPSDHEEILTDVSMQFNLSYLASELDRHLKATQNELEITTSQPLIFEKLEKSEILPPPALNNEVAAQSNKVAVLTSHDFNLSWCFCREACWLPLVGVTRFILRLGSWRQRPLETWRQRFCNKFGGYFSIQPINKRFQLISRGVTRHHGHGHDHHGHNHNAHGHSHHGHNYAHEHSHHGNNHAHGHASQHSSRLPPIEEDANSQNYEDVHGHGQLEHILMSGIEYVKGKHSYAKNVAKRIVLWSDFDKNGSLRILTGFEDQSLMFEMQNDELPSLSSMGVFFDIDVGQVAVNPKILFKEDVCFKANDILELLMCGRGMCYKVHNDQNVLLVDPISTKQAQRIFMNNKELIYLIFMDDPKVCMDARKVQEELTDGFSRMCFTQEDDTMEFVEFLHQGGIFERSKSVD